MSPRLMPLLPFLLVIASLAASGSTLAPPGDTLLRSAAARMKQNDFRGARDAALQAPPAGGRDLLLGIAAWRLGNLEEALLPLADAEKNFPLLADYALFYRADSLHRLGRPAEALPLLERLRKGFPKTPLLRKAEFLEVEALLAARDYRGALSACDSFIGKYPSGADAIASLFNSAGCRENLADPKGAAGIFRTVWLSYPASPLAEKALADLNRLRDAGEKIEPFTTEELYRRGITQYDLKRYGEAIATFDGILATMNPAPELRGKILLKKGLALYKSRKFADAEKLLAAGPGEKFPEEEFLFWRARALDRLGRDDEAAALFLRMNALAPKSELADDALLEAALIRKSQGKREEAVALLDRLLAAYPRTTLKNRALWEKAWNLYLSGDRTRAKEALRRQAEIPDNRERALYWLGRTLEADGNREEAAAVFASVAKDYPYGFYTLHYLGGSGAIRPLPNGDLLQSVPYPADCQRTRALIDLGLHDEARKELAAERKSASVKGKALAGLAKLYTEMEDYTTPYGMATREKPVLDPGQPLWWSLGYPRPFVGLVTDAAQKNGVPENVVYSVMRAESGFSPAVVSPAGAVGLMQLMPATARMVSGTSADTALLSTPSFNIRNGVRHLKDLVAGYKGNLPLTFAAYNAGAANVSRWQKRFAGLREDEFIESIPFGETRDYVKKVLAGAAVYAALYRAPEKPAETLPAAPAAVPPDVPVIPAEPLPPAAGLPESAPLAPVEAPVMSRLSSPLLPRR